MLRVLHFTDVHLDLRYRAGAKALCKTPPCCRDADGTARAAGSAVSGDDAGLAVLLVVRFRFVLRGALGHEESRLEGSVFIDRTFDDRLGPILLGHRPEP